MLKTLSRIDYHPKLVEILAKSTFSGSLAVNIIVPIVSSIVIYDFIPHIQIYIWLFLHVLLFIGRVFIAKKLQYFLKTESTKITAYLYMKFIVISLSALLYALLMWQSIVHTTEISIFIIATFISLLVAGSISTLSSVFPAFVLFVSLSIIPMISAFFYYSGEMFNIFAGMITIFLIIFLTSGYRQFIMLRDTISLKETFETIYEKSSDGILLINNGKFYSCNEAMVKMLKYNSKEEILNLHPSQLSPEFQPDGRESFEKANEMMDIAIKNGKNCFEWMHIRADGEAFWAEIVLTKINLAGEEFIHVVWRDISERKAKDDLLKELNLSLEQSNDELKEKNSNFQNLLDITMEAIIISDENQKIVDINQSGVALFNLKDKSEVIGKNLIKFVPDHSLPKVQKAIQNEIQEAYEIDLRKKDGVIFPTLIRSRNLIIDGKKMRIATILDLTQIKQKDQLLIQQSRQAAMGEMIGNIAHQWRQPLNALGLVLQNIYFEHQMGTLDDAFIERSVDKGKNLTRTMSKTIDDFRDFFKPNKIKEYFQIAYSIRNTIELVESSFQNSNIDIKIDLDESIEFHGYPSEFSQVILNILSNAKDALMENNIENKKVTISTYKKENNIFISISDNAGGIPEGVIKKVFEPYFSTKEEGKGTGIGLYMSKAIIETNMNGKLSVENSDIGAVFTISLRLEEEPPCKV